MPKKPSIAQQDRNPENDPIVLEAKAAAYRAATAQARAHIAALWELGCPRDPKTPTPSAVFARASKAHRFGRSLVCIRKTNTPAFAREVYHLTMAVTRGGAMPITDPKRGHLLGWRLATPKEAFNK